jgi:ABC-type spermidine/putrescine transport system permease subunit I
VIYFNTIMALIGSFQVFAVPYVMTGGGDGPERSLLFIATYLYQNAFDYWNMGYACAIGMILFLIILASPTSPRGSRSGTFITRENKKMKTPKKLLDTRGFRGC